MILDAKQLTTLQACPRRFLLEADYDVLRWRAKALFDATLRAGIVDITQGKSARDAAKEAKTAFVQVAANPGLDFPRGADSYKLAKDWCAMLDTVLWAAARWNLPRLELSPTVKLNGSEWQPLAYAGEDGALHRIITLDKWTDADHAREMHSWFVAGDMAATGRPMRIHVVEIGQVREGRRASPWARAWRHPTIPRVKRFAKKDGGDLKGWEPIYFADSPGTDAEEWVELMYRDRVAQDLVKEVWVDARETARAETLAQMMVEARRADVLKTERRSASWRAMPMARGACDGFVPCPWAMACYENVTEPALTGLYTRKGEGMLRVA